MPIGIGFSSANGDSTLLPPREHACRLVEVSPTTGTKRETGESVPQIKWVFEGVSWKSPEGKSGIISLWTGVKYGNSKANLTQFLDCLFGRSLTAAEVAKLDMEKLAGAIKGYVSVVAYKKDDGTMTSKYGGFRLPDNTPTPDPSQFFLDGASSGVATIPPAPTAPIVRQPEVALSGGLADPFGDDDIPDPFAE